MTRSERLEAQSKAERAAQRHREYVERVRLERAERASLEQRLDERREQRLAELRQEAAARRLAEQRQLKRESAALREPTALPSQEAAPERSAALRGQEAARRGAERTGLNEERQRRAQRLVELRAKRLEEHHQLRAESEASKQPTRPTRAPQAADHNEERQALEARRQRRAQRLVELRAKRLEEHRQLRAESEAPKQPAKATRAPQAADRSEARQALEAEREQRAQRLVELRAKRLEEHRQLRAESEASKQPTRPTRAPQAADRSEERKALEAEREQRTQRLEELRAKRLDEHGQLRAQEAARRRSARPTRAEEQGQQRSERPEDWAAQRLEKHRQWVRKSEVARERVSVLRVRGADRQRAHRQVLEQQKERLARVRESLGTQRLEQHRQLRVEAQATKEKAAVLRAQEAARRSEEIRTPAATTRAVGSEVRTQLAGAPVATLPEEPLEGLLWLSTVESYIVDENGAAVNLRGATVQGLDGVAPTSGQSFPEALSLDEANLSAISDFWGFNLIRLPFQPQTILSGNSSLSADELLSGLDDVVAALAGAGVYTLLALQAPTPPGATTAPLPDQSTVDCWSLLAQHYQDEAAVLFEIFAAALPIASDWLGNAPVLIGTIRRQHPASLLFVGNGSAGAETTGLPLRFTTGDPTPNLVYTIRVAPQHQFSTEEDLQLALLAKSFSVFASDWSDSAGGEFDRSAELAANTFSRYGIGWAASSWNAEPRLVMDSAVHNFVPTRWGLSVQRAMTLPTKEPLTKLLPRETEAN